MRDNIEAEAEAEAETEIETEVITYTRACAQLILLENSLGKMKCSSLVQVNEDLPNLMCCLASYTMA